MDERKMKALVEWVNALLPSEYIESLTQLKDGRHFCKLVSFLDRDQNTEFSVAEDRYRMVFSVLETYYHGSFLDKINIAQVIEQGNELEIAKICLLLLCAGVLDGSTVMKAATTLEVDNQLEIYEMIEPIIKPQSEQINLLDETVSAVLRKRREEPRALYSEAQMSSTPNCQTSGQNSENSPALRQTPILKMSLLGIGGLQDLCEVYSSSPVMSTKIKIQQQDQRIKCLTRELNAERHTCDELEAKLKELEKKDQIINDLQQQLTVAKRQLSASQLSHESEMFSQNEDQIEPMRERIMELSKEARDQREEIRFLKESNKELMEENETLKDKLNRFSAHHVQCSEYKESFMVAEKSLAELKELLHDKENQLTSLMKANQILESDLKSMQELYKQQQQEWRQAMETSIQNESGECLFGVVEKQLNEQIALLQESLANEQKLKNELKEQISRLQESLANEQREKDRWNQESHHLKDSLEALNRKYVKAEREMRSEKKRWSEMSERLEQELEEHRNIEREKQEVINRLNKILEANQQKISSLEERLHQQQICHEQQLSDLSCKLKGLQELNTRLQSELEDYKRSNHDLEQMLSEERVKVQRWQSEYSNVKQELDVVRESSQAELSELDNELQHLRSELNNTKQWKRDLEEQLVQRENELAEWQSRCAKLEKAASAREEQFSTEISQLNCKLETLQSELENMTKCICDLEEQLKMEIRKLNEETAKKHDELTATVCKSVQCLESTEAEFKVELEQLEKEKEELVRENLLLKDTISKLNSQLAASRDSVERLENLVLELRSRMKISSGEEYERRCEMYEKEQSLRDSLDELRDSKANQRHEIEEFTSRIRQLEDRMSSAGDELATLQEDYSAALQRTDALVSELCKEKQSHEKTRSHLQEELAVARQNRQEALTQLEEQKAVCNEMMARLEQESRERKALEYKLHQSEQQVSQLISHQQEIEAIQDKLEETCSTEKSEAKATEDMYKDQIERMENKYRQLKHKVEELNSKLKEQKEEFRHQLEKERTEWSQRYKQMKELKVQYEDDVLRFKELARSVHEHYQSKTEQLVQMEQELNSCKEHAHIMERKFREADVEVAALKLQLKEETCVHKKLAAEINSLKTQLDHANRQLRAKQKSTKASPTMDDGIPLETSFSVDPDKDKQNHVTSSASDDLQSPEHPRKLTKNKHAGSNFSLASSNSSVVSESEAIMPLHRYPTRWRTSIGRLSKENEKMAEFGLNQDQYLRAKENRNLGGTFGITEDEPEEFEFGRLSELQRRNTLCLPHMRSSYPVETQVYDPKTIREEEVKVTDAFSNLVEDQKRLQRKRRSASELLLEDQAESRTPNNSTSRSASKRKTRDKIVELSTPGVKLYKRYSPMRAPSKQRSQNEKNQPLSTYQRPGPPTPGVTPAKATPQRFRTRNSPSPVVSTKKKRRSIRHFGPLKEKVKPKESDEIREKISRLSLAYSIGFTPKKSRRQTSQVRNIIKRFEFSSKVHPSPGLSSKRPQTPHMAGKFIKGPLFKDFGASPVLGRTRDNTADGTLRSSGRDGKQLHHSRDHVPTPYQCDVPRILSLNDNHEESIINMLPDALKETML